MPVEWLRGSGLISEASCYPDTCRHPDTMTLGLSWPPRLRACTWRGVPEWGLPSLLAPHPSLVTDRLFFWEWDD